MANLLIDHETRYVYPFRSVITIAHKIDKYTHLEYVDKSIETYLLLGFTVGIIQRKGNTFTFKTKGSRWYEESFTVVIRTSGVFVEYPIPF